MRQRQLGKTGREVSEIGFGACPPWEVYYRPEVFEACDRLVEDGLVRAYGVSVKKVEEGLKRWILGFEAVSTVIPGAKTPEQARANVAAAELAPLQEPALRTIDELYRSRIAPQVHQRW